VILSPKEYAEKGGTKCPSCQGEDIDTNPVQTDTSVAWQDCKCLSCHSTWTDEYKLVSYNNFVESETQGN
jgi:transposase-like protein